MSVATIPHGTTGGYTNHRCRCDQCRSAYREYIREYMRARRTVPAKAEQDLARRRERARVAIDSALAAGCARCGGPAEHMHHRDPGTKVMNVSQIWKHAGQQALLDEIAKCDPMCGGCHVLEHKERR